MEADQKTLRRRFDSNDDGRIDEAEWEAARHEARREVAAEHREASVQPGVNVIGAPDDKRPFLIAADHGQRYARGLQRKARWAFAGFVLLAALTVGLLAARF